MTEAELQRKQQQNQWARTLAGYNINYKFDPNEHREDPEKVRKAIMELFPKIPEEDLDAIVKHAWEEGTNRVGNVTNMALSRRVQLATIARIRHKHTDYDVLLSTFGWKEARSMVEIPCLEVLIKWRGENDDDDEGLEEIVRETIVIDDEDEDEDGNGTSEGNGEDDSGISSESDIEISHHVANDGDLGAEISDEQGKAYANRFQPERHRFEIRNKIAQEKIGAARKRLQEPKGLDRATLDLALCSPLAKAHGRHEIKSSPPGPILQVQPDRYGRFPPEVIGPDGVKYILVSETRALSSLGNLVLSYMIQVRANAEKKDEIPRPKPYPPPEALLQDLYRCEHSSATSQPTHGSTHPSDGRFLREYFPNQAIMSIERDDFSSRRKRAVIPPDANIVDLTSSPPSRPLSRRVSPALPSNGRYGTATHDAYSQVAPRSFSGSFIPDASMHQREIPVTPSYPVPYNPYQPMYHSHAADGHFHILQHGQQLPLGASNITSNYRAPQVVYPQQDQANDHSRTDHHLISQQSQPPLPVHGAPAPVQLAAQGTGLSANGLKAHSMQRVGNLPPYVPTNGDVAPAQYYDRSGFL